MMYADCVRGLADGLPGTALTAMECLRVPAEDIKLSITADSPNIEKQHKIEKGKVQFYVFFAT